MLAALLIVVLGTFNQGGIASVASEEAPLGQLGLLENHLCRLPYTTDYVSSEPLELHYELHAVVEAIQGNLEGVEVTITNPQGYSTEDVWPEPAEIGADYIHWSFDTIEEGGFQDFGWCIPELTYTESLGFSVSRGIDQTVIPDGVESITQTITIEVEHLETDRWLCVGIGYSQEYVTVQLIDNNLDEYTGDEWYDRIEWGIPPGHDSSQIFMATFKITRKPGILGQIDVYPRISVDSRISEWLHYSSLTELEAGAISVSASNNVNWQILHEKTKRVFIDGRELRQIREIKIGVTAADDGSLELANPIVSTAEEDINNYCIENNIPFRFSFVIKSNKGSDEIALQNTMEFHEMGINLIVGHPWSSQCAACLQYINENDILLLSSSSTSPLIAFPDNLYRLAPNDLIQGHVLVKLYLELGIRAIAIYYRDDEWGRGLADVIEKGCLDNGIEVLAKISFAPNTFDPQDLEQIDSIMENSGYELGELGFELIKFGGSDVLNEAYYGEYAVINKIIWFGTDASTPTTDILYNAFEPAKNLKLIGPVAALDWEDPKYLELNERYKAITGENMYFYDVARYDCLWVLAKAVMMAGGTDTQAVRAAMEELLQEYHGVSGTITIDENGDRVGADYDLWTYGQINGEPSYIRYGYYDLETNTITIYQ